MKRKIPFLILYITLATSLLSAALLFFYLNIESNFPVAIATMGTACFLSLSAILTLLIYAFKKIYYRGEILENVFYSSLRQGSLVSIAIIGNITLYSLQLLNWRTGGLFVFVLFLTELMIESVSKD